MFELILVFSIAQATEGGGASIASHPVGTFATMEACKRAGDEMDITIKMSNSNLQGSQAMRVCVRKSETTEAAAR